MPDGWIAALWAAFVAAALGVLIVAAGESRVPSPILLAALIVAPIVLTLVGRRRFSHRRQEMLEPSQPWTAPPARARPKRDSGDTVPKTGPVVASDAIHGDDWEALGTMYSALDTRTLDWLRTNDYVTPWLDRRARVVIDLEPLIGSVVAFSSGSVLTPSLNDLHRAVTAYVAFYDEQTSLDPLLLGGEWRFFERDEAVIEAESGVGEELWGRRAAHLHELAVGVADAYAEFVSVASQDARVRRKLAVPH